ncbi:hypothetical protein SLE2022_178890 [Rubroshorea leprosula]
MSATRPTHIPFVLGTVVSPSTRLFPSYSSPIWVPRAAVHIIFWQRRNQRGNTQPPHRSFTRTLPLPTKKKKVPSHSPPSWPPFTISPFLWLQTSSTNCHTPVLPLFLSAAHSRGGSEASWLSEIEGISLRNWAAGRFLVDFYEWFFTEP